MAVETLQDLNAQACCCGFTLCPVPVMDCESVSASATAAGFFNPDDATWILYRTQVFTATKSDPYNDTYTVATGSAMEKTTYNFTEIFEATVGGGCQFLGSGLGSTCETNGAYTSTYTWGSYRSESSTVRTQVSGSISGEDCAWYDTYTFQEFEDDVPLAPASSDDFHNTLISTNYSGLLTFTDVTTYENPYTHTEWVSAVRAGLLTSLSFALPLACIDGECSSLLSADAEPTEKPFPPFPQHMSFRKARVRFQIPAQIVLDPEPPHAEISRWTGTYFKITYDILEEPDGWDATIADPDYTGDPPAPQIPDPTAPARSFVSEDNVIVWTGPGTGDPDDPSWFTGWITIDPPTVPGTRRVVNIRFVCRENWFVGVVPQTTGDAVELPAP